MIRIFGTPRTLIEVGPEKAYLAVGPAWAAQVPKNPDTNLNCLWKVERRIQNGMERKSFCAPFWETSPEGERGISRSWRKRENEKDKGWKNKKGQSNGVVILRKMQRMGLDGLACSAHPPTPGLGMGVLVMTVMLGMKGDGPR